MVPVCFITSNHSGNHHMAKSLVHPRNKLTRIACDFRYRPQQDVTRRNFFSAEVRRRARLPPPGNFPYQPEVRGELTRDRGTIPVGVGKLSRFAASICIFAEDAPRGLPVEVLALRPTPHIRQHRRYGRWQWQEYVARISEQLSLRSKDSAWLGFERVSGLCSPRGCKPRSPYIRVWRCCAHVVCWLRWTGN
ncbi:MAG: hypothetical protein KatS3mg110_3470 [Pirellulaceae bacterium]|nr:MAG: hypothetical protein KatS3mg110_3470 [Pirellulaceae bacterium]